MKEWLETVTMKLIETSQPSPKRLGTAVSLICTIRKFFNQKYISQFNEDVMIALLHMMSFTHTTAREEYSFLKSLMKKEASKLDISSMHAGCFTINCMFCHRKQVLESVTGLFTYAVDKLNKKKNYFIDLMKALPLIHFVRHDYGPHEHVMPSKEEWGDTTLKLDRLQDSILHNSGYLSPFLLFLFSLSPLSHTHTHMHIYCP